MEKPRFTLLYIILTPVIILPVAAIIFLTVRGSEAKQIYNRALKNANAGNFAAAAKEGSAEFLADSEKMRNIRDYAIEKITAECPEISLNLPKKSAPHVLSVTLPSIKSETMLHFLSGKGIFVSSGSACSSHSRSVSSVLLAFGLSESDADCTLRVSLSEYNTTNDIDELCAALSQGIDSLVRIRR